MIGWFASFGLNSFFYALKGLNDLYVFFQGSFFSLFIRLSSGEAKQVKSLTVGRDDGIRNGRQEVAFVLIPLVEDVSARFDSVSRRLDRDRETSPTPHVIAQKNNLNQTL